MAMLNNQRVYNVIEVGKSTNIPTGGTKATWAHMSHIPNTHGAQHLPFKHEHLFFNGLVQGKICRKTPYLMVKKKHGFR